MLTARKLQAIVAGSGLLCFGAGGLAGFTFAQKRLEDKYNARLEEELAASEKFYKTLDADKVPDISEVLAEAEAQDATETMTPEEYRDVIQKEGTTNYSQYAGLSKPPEEIVTTKRIFNDIKELDETSEEERLALDPQAPRVITQEVFFAAEEDYEQVTVTFFEGDGVLADAREIPITDRDEVVGDSSLTRFGEGSEDPNVVYVRNDKLEMDIEILKSPGKYSEEVAGFLEHSDPVNKLREYWQ